MATIFHLALYLRSGYLSTGVGYTPERVATNSASYEERVVIVVAKTAPPSRTSATAYGRHRWQSAAPFPRGWREAIFVLERGYWRGSVAWSGGEA